jgi:hypothetical protein
VTSCRSKASRDIERDKGEEHWGSYRRGPASREQQRDLPSSRVVVTLEVVAARCRSRHPSGRHGEMQGQCGVVYNGGGESSRRCCASTRSARVLVCRWSGGGTVNLVLCAAGPHLLFIAQCDGSPPAMNGLERPRSGRV